MCGIAGYIGSKEIDDLCIRSCLASMHHRGPDNAAYKKWLLSDGKSRVALLHTRLSINDLDPRANQPFNIGKKWLVMNGELYNFLEIRKELEHNGRTFSTNCDSEVLIQAIDACGYRMLDTFEGMWAFAIYDEVEETLTLCRDRFGEKPLYIFRDETGLYFGSEIKFIAALRGKRLEINYDHLLRYLVNGYKAIYKSDSTFFKKVTELNPATKSTISSDLSVTTEIYWKPVFCPNATMTYKEAVDGARERLIRSVELRLRADVPLAFCMSGGVDSNSLISIAKRIFHYDVHGFTIINTDPRYDEREVVAKSVEELGISHTQIPVTTTCFLENLRTLIRQHDAPVFTISYYAQWLLMKSIAEHGYRVSISGTAADEMFSGYYDHHLMYLYEVRNDPVRLESARHEWRQHVLPLVRNRYLKDENLFFNDPKFRSHIFDESEIFRSYLVNDWWEEFQENGFTEDLMRNRMLNEMFREVIPVILHEDDLNAMSFSIENRSPFLDRNLFEFCYTIPTKYLVQDGSAKAVLRDAMRQIVPDVVLDQRLKVGFNAPIFSFLDHHDPAVLEELLRPSPIFEFIRKDKIQELLDHEELTNSESKFLFNFLNAKIFLEEFAMN